MAAAGDTCVLTWLPVGQPHDASILHPAQLADQFGVPMNPELTTVASTQGQKHGVNAPASATPLMTYSLAAFLTPGSPADGDLFASQDSGAQSFSDPHAAAKAQTEANGTRNPACCR
jgi:hypothetical protein